MSDIYRDHAQLTLRDVEQRFSVSSEAASYAYAVFEFSLGLGSALAGVTAFHQMFEQSAVDLNIAAGTGLISALFFVTLAHTWGLYKTPALLDPSSSTFKVLAVWCLSFSLLLSVVFVLKQGVHLSRGGMLLHFTVFAVLAPIARQRTAKLLYTMSSNGALKGRRTIVVGEEAELDKLSSRSMLVNFGLKELSRVTLPRVRNDLVSAEHLARCAANVMLVARDLNAEEIAIAIEWGHTESLKSLTSLLQACPLPVRLLPDRMIASMAGQRSDAASPRYTSVELQRAPLTRTERTMKRYVDVILSIIGLLILAPFLLAVAAAIRLDSPGKVIFRQRRAGFNGRQFTIYKFRSMRVMEDGEKIVQATRKDTRVTMVGKVIRRTSIDEIPQLFNVLRGDMSLVGPRPHALAHDYEYGAVLSRYAFRHHVKPGITGWAQVNGSRGETTDLGDMERRVNFDLWYISNWSFGLDCVILIRTCFDMVLKKAY